MLVKEFSLKFDFHNLFRIHFTMYFAVNCSKLCNYRSFKCRATYCRKHCCGNSVSCQCFPISYQCFPVFPPRETLLLQIPKHFGSTSFVFFRIIFLSLPTRFKIRTSHCFSLFIVLSACFLICPKLQKFELKK